MKDNNIYTILSKELYGVSYYTGKGLTTSQVNSLYVAQAAINAVATIFERVGVDWYTPIIMYQPTSTTYSYIWGAFSSSCGNQGTLTHSTEPYLKAKTCTDLAPGAGGHRYGMCQMGAAQRAKNGELSTSIVFYYYTGCALPTCRIS